VPNIGKLIYAVNKIEILEDWTTTPFPKKQTLPEL